MVRTRLQNRDQAGQTIIETVVAIFVMVMGITAAVGLAIYAFNSSTNVTNQIVAMGLAREGIEGVKNMRDTNWLRQAAINTDCHNYQSTTTPNSQDASCYKGWRDQSAVGGYSLATPSASTTYTLGIAVPDTEDANRFWLLAANPMGYGLTFSTATSFPTFTGYYVPNDTNSPAPTLNGYFRQIILEEDTASPYNTDVGAKLKVTSRVWWQGKKCPASATYDGAKAACRVEAITFLTNWKNY